MISTYPSMMDGIDYYLFVPMLATLYGRDAFPHRYLRVVDSRDVGKETRYVTKVAEGSEPVGSGIVETVDLSTYMEFVSYGYTPYIECAFTNFATSLDLSSVASYIFTEAALRSYEARAKTLMSLAEKKQFSIVGKTTASTTTSELVDETLGVLALWEQLMNYGEVRPHDCLTSMPYKSRYASIPMKTFRSRFDELEHRMLVSNYRSMRYKLTQREHDVFKDYGRGR